MSTWSRVTGILAVAATTALLTIAVGNATAGPPAVPESALAAAAAAATPGLLYTAITPCRVVDTRVGVPVAKIPANGTRSFVIRGTTGFTAQGGPLAGCGIPESATAVMTSLTASQPAGQGYLRIWPYGQPEPNATVLNFPAAGIGDTTGAVINLGSGSFDVTAKVYNYAAHLVIDVSGYFAPQIYGTFTSTGALYNGNGSLTADAHSGTGYYTILADRDLSGCTPVITAYYYQYVASGYVAGSKVFVQLATVGGAQVDYYFHVQVSC